MVSAVVFEQTARSIMVIIKDAHAAWGRDIRGGFIYLGNHHAAGMAIDTTPACRETG
jgi:hypothetical protein